MVRKNGELGHDGHANDERRDMSDDLKDGEKFQRGGEKFQREGGLPGWSTVLTEPPRSNCGRSTCAVVDQVRPPS